MGGPGVRLLFTATKLRSREPLPSAKKYEKPILPGESLGLPFPMKILQITTLLACSGSLLPKLTWRD
jgi:hypothetical protein